MQTQVEQVLDAMRPVIQQDGGDIELVSVSAEGEVQIRFQGACVSCPSRALTLQTLIERNLKEYVPGFTSVVAEDM
ncbi:MAG: hypothetical protein CMJ39_05320 [Phycisphaerae bacterium]|nr:hypothetical protein [Phycisphaerae bacterium]